MEISHQISRNITFLLILTLAISLSSALKAENFDDAFEDGEWGQQFDRSFVQHWEANPPRGYPTLSKKNQAAMRAAVKRYAGIVKRGGWQKTPSETLKVGSNSPAVAILRKRLQATGDLGQDRGYANTFDYYVEQALQKFQRRHGLAPSGVTDEATISALNVAASARLRQLRTNLIRYKKLTKKVIKDERYVLANIPAAQVEAVEGADVASRHAAIVGKLDRQTPVLQSKIHEINFNPYWTLPRSIVRKRLDSSGY